MDSQPASDPRCRPALPADPPEMLPQVDAETEWWYYSGPLRAGDREFFFHLVFFRRSAAAMKIAGWIPARRLGWIRFAHFSLTEPHLPRFRYAQRRYPGPASRGAGELPDGLHLHIDRWSLDLDDDGHHLRAHMRGVDLDLDLDPRKPIVHHANSGSSFHRGGDSHSHYLSCTRMRATGTLRLDGQPMDVAGEAWMDREIGRFRPGRDFDGWEWFGIQLDDGSEWMAYQMHGDGHRNGTGSGATRVAPDGATTRFPPGSVTLVPDRWWTSPRSSIRYPVGWTLAAGSSVRLRLDSSFEAHEIDARPSCGMIYWESPVRVSGRIDGRPVAGWACAEQMHSPVRRLAGTYDFENDNLGLRDWLINEVRLPAATRGGEVAATRPPDTR